MDPLMINKTIVSIKRFLTQVALKTFLSTVYALVIHKTSFTCKGFPTFLTPKGLLTSEDS